MTMRNPILDYQAAQLERLLEVYFEDSGVTLLRFDGNLLLRMANRDAFMFRYHVRGFDDAERVFAPCRQNPVTGVMRRNDVMNGYGERVIPIEHLGVNKSLAVVAERAFLRACKRYRVLPWGAR